MMIAMLVMRMMQATMILIHDTIYIMPNIRLTNILPCSYDNSVGQEVLGEP